ncbi:MAG: DUF3800 domain-containing protein [Planctomycetes bacterium]|nr:DUF3800 domain-containing protein [Planctomycetota bacterium]
MFILYVDASGQPEVAHGASPLYAMAGICVHEGTWFALESRFNTLKARYSCPGVEFELHAKDFCTTISEQDEIENFCELNWNERRCAVLERRSQKIALLKGEERRRKLKKYRATDPFVHLLRSERTRLLQEAIELIGTHTGIQLFGEVVDKGYLAKQTGARDAVEHTFTQLVSRFDMFLDRYNRNAPGTGVDKGLMVMDDEPSHAETMRDLFTRFRAQGHPWGKVNHVLESPFFVDSKMVSAVQAVDLCAYVLRRYVERANTRPNLEEVNFRRIFHQFDRAGGHLHGLRHYCSRQSCRCLICQEKGHAPVDAGLFEDVDDLRDENGDAGRAT